MATLSSSAEAVKRDVAEVTAAFAPPAGPRPDPCAPNFIRLCEDPTPEEILINSLYVSLRGQVEDGSTTQAEADRKLNEYRQRLEREPFVPGLTVFMSAALEGGAMTASEILELIGRKVVLLKIARKTKALFPPAGKS
jgi:hypothetical protein